MRHRLVVLCPHELLWRKLQFPRWLVCDGASPQARPLRFACQVPEAIVTGVYPNMVARATKHPSHRREATDAIAESAHPHGHAPLLPGVFGHLPAGRTFADAHRRIAPTARLASTTSPSSTQLPVRPRLMPTYTLGSANWPMIRDRKQGPSSNLSCAGTASFPSEAHAYAVTESFGVRSSPLRGRFARSHGATAGA